MILGTTGPKITINNAGKMNGTRTTTILTSLHRGPVLPAKLPAQRLSSACGYCNTWGDALPGMFKLDQDRHKRCWIVHRLRSAM